MHARALCLLLAIGCGRVSFEHGSGSDSDAPSGDSTGPAGDGGTSGWWDPSWQHRIKLTLSNAGAAALTDFPLLVRLNTARFPYADAQSTGRDVRFVDADGTTLLSYEIEQWNTTGVSTLWVRVPQIDANASTDYIWLYYGNPAVVSDAQAPSLLWSAYAAVYHLRENPAGGAPQIHDSTVNANLGTTQGTMPAGAQMPGLLGGSLELDGNDDWINAPQNASLRLTGNVTITTWIRRGMATRHEWILDFATPESEQEGNNHLYEISFDSPSNQMHLDWEFNGGSDQATISSVGLAAGANVWTLINVTRDVANKRVVFYENGVQLGNPVAYGNDPTGGLTGSLWLGGMLDSTTSKQPFLGELDEIRIEPIVRSAAWLGAQYRSMTDAIVTYGAPETY